MTKEQRETLEQAIAALLQRSGSSAVRIPLGAFLLEGALEKAREVLLSNNRPKVTPSLAAPITDGRTR